MILLTQHTVIECHTKCAQDQGFRAVSGLGERPGATSRCPKLVLIAKSSCQHTSACHLTDLGIQRRHSYVTNSRNKPDLPTPPLPEVHPSDLRPNLR